MAKYRYTILVHNGVHDLEMFPTRIPHLEKEEVLNWLNVWFANSEDDATFHIFSHEEIFDDETGEQFDDETGEVE